MVLWPLRRAATIGGHCEKYFRKMAHTNPKVSVRRLTMHSFPRVPVKHSFYYSRGVRYLCPLLCLQPTG